MMELVLKALKKFAFILFVLLVKVSSLKERECRNDKWRSDQNHVFYTKDTK